MQYSKDDYQKEIAKRLPLTREKITQYRREAEEHWILYPQRYCHGTHNADVSGEYIGYSKNTKDSYLVVKTEDSKYCMYIGEGNARDLYDFTSFGTSSELMYDTLQAGEQCSGIRFGWWVAQGVRNVDYSVMISGGHDLFGCVALKKKEYCILNKQYTPDEYTALRGRIIEEMNKHPYTDAKGRVYRYGEFFPPEMSPFGYNETNAQEFFPLSEDEAIDRGYQWYENTQNIYQSTIHGKGLPESIENVGDDITKEVIGCSETGKAFRIIPSEIDFYRRMKLPLPSIHPDVRHTKRTRYRNSIKLWHR
ncbi:MAG: hypothetical protein AAB920_03935, partial [Patescibacteria group bacterium]